MARAWSASPGVLLGALTALNGLNYLDRYVAAATLPLILAGLAISDAQGGLLQSLFITPRLGEFAAAVGESVLASQAGDVADLLSELDGLSEEEIRSLLAAEAGAV